jgi:hypothetical protein
MSLPKECDVRNPPSNQPGIVWSKRSLTTQCANPRCFKELLYLREGRLELLELEPHADEQLRPDLGDHPKAAIDDRVKSGHREKA